MPVPFRPHPFLIGGHLQTLATTVLPIPKIAYVATQHRVQLPDGDTIVLHDDCPESWERDKPVAILLHGLCGCHGANYMIRLADKFSRKGVRVFRMDMRGCGAGRELARGLPHSGRSEDLLCVLSHVANTCGQSPIWPIGVSMGGNIVLKTLGEIGKGIVAPPFPAEQIQRAAVVAPPVDPARCCSNLSRPTLRPYGRYFINKLKSRVPPRVAERDDWQAIDWQPHPKTLWDFDDLVTAPLSGFASVEDYYQQAASAPLASHIQAPTLVLASEDDPIIPIDVLRNVDWAERTELQTTRRGGHVGFIARRALPTGDRYWMDAKLLYWFGLLESSVIGGT